MYIGCGDYKPVAVAKSSGTAFSGYRIGQASQEIRVVRLNADDDALVQQDSDPHAKTDHDRHSYGMDLPVGAVDTHQLCTAGNDLCRAGNCGAVLGAHVRDDLWIAGGRASLYRSRRESRIRFGPGSR